MGGVAALAVTLCHSDKILRWKILSAIAFTMPLAQAIGRLANAVNGEFYEKILNLPWWSVELAFNMCLFGVMTIFYKRKISSKKLVGTYLIGYGLIRLLLEYARDHIFVISGMPVASIFSVISVIIGTWLLVVRD